MNKPQPDRKLEKEEILLVIGSDEDIEKMLKENK